ncbi:hypothetical protein [Mesobacillus jeotgali]|nr:hypothetical protein [Mesobacillus jeotgali]UYZ24101.1 hypothetical protein FOF60_11435 [Mesobacillus jeotgali]
MVLRKQGVKVAASILALTMAFGSASYATSEPVNGKSGYSHDQKVVA